MSYSDAVLQAKIDFITRDLHIIAEKVRDLVSPLNAIRFYVDDMMEDTEYKELKSHLADIDRVAAKCISIARELAALTMPYFDL